MAAKSQDKIIFGSSLTLLLVSAGWMAVANSKLSRPSLPNPVDSGSSAYVPAGIDAPAVNTTAWRMAEAQTSGKEWVYDVFTPPEIYYNSGTKQFTVTAPNTNPEVVAPPAAFGVELIRIRPDAFRLQLVGYVGGEGDYRGTFENALSGETVMGRAGKTFVDLGLNIKTFAVIRKEIISKDSMKTYVTEATAVVVDVKTGDEITLTNKERRINGEPYAIFKVDGVEDSVQRRAGESFQVGSTTYNLVSVTAEPPSVLVRKESPDLKEPVIKTLTPFVPVAPILLPEVAPATEQPAASSPFPFGT